MRCWPARFITAVREVLRGRGATGEVNAGSGSEGPTNEGGRKADKESDDVPLARKGDDNAGYSGTGEGQREGQ